MIENENTPSSGETRADTLATSIALGQPGALDPRAAAFLEKQSQLIDLQIEELKREDAIRHRSLRVRHISDVMKVAFELSVAFIVLAIAVATGSAIWNAANDKGLVIEAFQVPPDLAAKGLTGEVVATQLLDRLSSLQAQTVSHRAPSSYANNWGNDIKVQIPDTGVSIGELNRYLRSWLGHETRISGEIYHTENGIAVTARAGGDASPTFTGTEADLDKLIQQAAEAVYRSTQPYRYAVYLTGHNRNAEAGVIYQNLVRTGSVEDRAWAYVGLENQLAQQGDFAGADELLRRAVATKPDFLLAYGNMAANEGTLQHDEQSLDAQKQAIALESGGEKSGISPTDMALGVLLGQVSLAQMLGDSRRALDIDRRIEAMPDTNSWENAFDNDLQACAASHDAACLREKWAALPASTDSMVLLNRDAILLLASSLLEHWRDVIGPAPGLLAKVDKLGKAAIVFREREEYPVAALADAGLGDFKSAHGLIDKTPVDCVVCLRIRGRIDELERNWGGANYWFARAVVAAPSVPFGYSDWGRALLDEGDYDGAIAKFGIANLKGPHFADPLEMWGEALMGKNRSDLALAKFAEADSYAPNWGRLHLEWGEALVYAGKPEDAKKQFALAAHLDLSAADAAALATRIKRNG